MFLIIALRTPRSDRGSLIAPVASAPQDSQLSGVAYRPPLGARSCRAVLSIRRHGAAGFAPAGHQQQRGAVAGRILPASRPRSPQQQSPAPTPSSAPAPAR